MKRNLLCASGALATSLLLAACSSGSASQALPNNGASPTHSQAQGLAPVSRSAHVIVVGVRHRAASCDYSKFTDCVTVGRGYPASLEVCINQSGSGCSSGSFPSITWYGDILSVKNNKPYKKIANYFYPNPGNPTIDDIYTTHKLKNSHGIVKYYQNGDACTYTSDCVTFAIGIATK
jgi:hypothetical protein